MNHIVHENIRELPIHQILKFMSSENHSRNAIFIFSNGREYSTQYEFTESTHILNCYTYEFILYLKYDS